MTTESYWLINLRGYQLEGKNGIETRTTFIFWGCLVMNKIIDYTVLDAGNLSNLRLDVEQYIKMGRQPFGDLQVVSVAWDAVRFYQPIVKYLDSNSQEWEINENTSKQP